MDSEARAIIRQVKKYNPNVNEEKITLAVELSKQAHAHQKRDSGEPYFEHPMAVAQILIDMHLDEDSIITALLHDTVEDTEVTLEEIEAKFGDNVAKLVDGVTKLDKIQFQPDNIRQAENFRKLLVAMSEDIRVLIVKLADRLHNLRTTSTLKPEKKARIAHETLEIYSPLAERIGVQKIKNELQDLSFEILYPEERKSIITRLEFLRKDGGVVIDKIESHIKKTLSDMGIQATVLGREKTPCSIWQKMKQKNISFEQLSDIIAFRVIVEDVLDCYSVLGIIHAAYHMVPGSFKDYISTPKDNGYRSLHTVVVGPEKQRIELQIRTNEMNEVNELGVAAHWSYKQGQKYATDGKQYRWIRELLQILESSHPEEFLEHTKLEIYEDQVFCFTPQGDIVALPKGSTPIDFAYSLHTDVGHTCIGAKINGRIAPLRTKLENGDQVEIIRSKSQLPSSSWEKFAVTGKARSEIKKFVRLQQRKEYEELGKNILEKYLNQQNLYLTEDNLNNCLKIFKKKNIEDFYAAIGEGMISRADVANLLKANQTPSKRKSIFKLFDLKSKINLFSYKKKKLEAAVPIKGLIPGMAINFGACCHPLPGDPIIGIVHTGKGITIHTAGCEILENFNSSPERWVEVSWDKDLTQEKHIGRLRAVLLHEVGSLAVLTNVIAQNIANISNIKVMSRSNDFFEVVVDVEVNNTNHLTNIIASLRSKQCIHSVERFKLQ